MLHLEKDVASTQNLLDKVNQKKKRTVQFKITENLLTDEEAMYASFGQ